jgi:MFS family permease
MTWGAAGIGLGTIVIGAAPTFAILILGFAIYGMASGPLAHTADVVLVEAYPNSPDRIYSRSTLIDTIGALLAPLLVSITFWINLDWRWLMIVLGSSSLIYAIMILKTRFPKQNETDDVNSGDWKQAISVNLKNVISNRLALTWLGFLFIHMVLEAPMHFTTVWLREQAGMSQALIGIYRMLEMAVAILSLLVLDRWLNRSGYRKILLVATVGLVILYPIWLLTPGIWQRFALSVPISFLFTFYWPIGKGQGLASSRGTGGTFTSIHSLLYLIPLPLLFGLLAESITLTSSMLIVTLAGLIAMVVIILGMPSNGGVERSNDDR